MPAIGLTAALMMLFGPPTHYPDPLVAMEGIVAVVVADVLDSTDYHRSARFQTVARVEGSAPDRFTAISITHPGFHYRPGRHLLLLAPPPTADPPLRALMGLDSAQFDLVPMTGLAGPLSSEDSASRVDVAKAIWNLRAAPPEEKSAAIERWVRGSGLGVRYGLIALAAHPELANDTLRADLLRLAGGIPWADLARLLAVRPPEGLSDSIARLSRGDDQERLIAAKLAMADTTLKTRHWLVDAAKDSSVWIRIEVASALRPTVGAEREALMEIATRRDRWDRDRVTQRIARVTAWQTLASDPARFDWADFDRHAHGDRDLQIALDPARPLSMIRLMLDSPEPAVRDRAYGEISRRGDEIGLARMERRLLQDPDDHPTLRADRRSILFSVARYDAPGAQRMIERAARTREDDLRVAVLSATAQIGDPRGRKVARRYVGRSCGGINGFVRSKIADALAVVGNDRDAALMEKWAQECPEVRVEALHAVGRLRGIERLVEVMRALDVDRRTAGWVRNRMLGPVIRHSPR